MLKLKLMKNRPIVLFLENADFSTKALLKLEEVFDTAFCSFQDLESYIEKERVVGLFVRLKFYIDDNVIKNFRNLKFIISPTTGLNHLDTSAIAQRKISVVSLKGESEFLSSITATAELTWGLILSLTRLIPSALDHVASGEWDRDRFRGIDLAGRTLGIVGYGRLGHIIEKYASAFRMRVLIYDAAPSIPNFGENVSFEKLLRESDVVTVHVDVNPGSLSLFNERAFKCMKASALFINTSRGEIVDEAALLQALLSRQIAAAAIDVLRDEQTGLPGNPLLQSLPELKGRLLITPHIGGASFDSMAKTEDFIVKKVIDMGFGETND